MNLTIISSSPFEPMGGERRGNDNGPPATIEVAPPMETSNAETLLSNDSAFVYGNVLVEVLVEEESSS